MNRGNYFDQTKLSSQSMEAELLEESQGQLEYEWQHLLTKLRLRDPIRFGQFSGDFHPDPHPLFTMVPGEIRSWKHVYINF